MLLPVNFDAIKIIDYSFIMLIMELYPPSNSEVTFEQMEYLSRRVIAKDKTYPAGSISGMATIMREVYANRIFAFRFLKLFRKSKRYKGL